MKGSVLLWVLIIEIIISWMVILEMHELWLFTQFETSLLHQHQHVYQAEALAHHLIDHFSLKDAQKCMVNELKPYQLGKTFVNACYTQFKQQNFQYQWSDLGVVECLQSQHHPTHHWLLSLAQAPKPQTMLQLRFMTEETYKKGTECAWMRAEQVDLGVISWRWMSY